MKKRISIILTLVILLTFSIFFSVHADYTPEKNKNAFLAGDINSDEKISTLDALSILKDCANISTLTDSQKIIGDIDQNGQISTLDALILLKFNAGLISDLGIKEFKVIEKENSITLKNKEKFFLSYIKPTFDFLIDFESENTNVATVNENGIISASSKDGGKTKITISSPSNLFEPLVFNVTVTPELHIYKGIDVSSWQGDIDWKKVKNDGIEFAIIRAGFGYDITGKQIDNKFFENVKNAKAEKIPIGAYYYSYAETVEEATLEAEYFVNLCKNIDFEYPLFYDIEDELQINLSKELNSDMVIAFCETVEAAGLKSGIYSYNFFLINHLIEEKISKYDHWIANWDVEKPNYDYPYTLWQYSNKGVVDGINGYVDLDYCFSNYLENKETKNNEIFKNEIKFRENSTDLFDNSIKLDSQKAKISL